MEYAKKTPLRNLERQEDFVKISDNTLIEILTYKVNILEPAIQEIKGLPDGVEIPGRYGINCYNTKDYGTHRKGKEIHCTECDSYKFRRVEQICNKVYL